jgi:transposase InsO family protein
VRFAAIAGWAERDGYPVDFMCRQLGVSRSGYYKWRDRDKSARQAANEELTVLIREVYWSCNRPGVRRVWAELRARGYRVGRVRVWRLMRNAGLCGRHGRAWKKTTVRGDRPVDAPDLVARQFNVSQPNQVWCGDITYVKTWEGWAYVATVIDLYSRKLVGWAVADNMETSLVKAALSQALKHRRPRGKVIFHSDRGAQYTSQEFFRFCREHGVVRSLGRTGSCFDNAVAESFNATYKKELIHTRPWPSLAVLKRATFDWVETHYNQTRRHSTLDYLTIPEYELGYRHIDQLAA